MHWFHLILAITMEIAGTTSMKLSAGFTRIIPSLFLFLFYGLSFTFLTLALRVLPVGMTYAVWSGVGTALITVIGVAWFGESMNLLKLVSLLLIVIGVAGLHLGHQGIQQ